MFSVGVETDDQLVTWHVVCDACGQELDVLDSPLTIFKIKGLDELQAMNPDACRQVLQRLEEARRSQGRLVLLDSTAEVIEEHRGLGDRILAHVRACARA